MPKRPYFNFYPADWRGNTKLKFASAQERSAWLEFMCLAHDSDEYGVLRQELERIATAIPCHVSTLQSLTEQDILKGCHRGEHFAGFVYRDRNGADHTLIPPCEGPIWFSSRMVVDEHLRKVAVAAGKLGGNPTLNHTLNPAVKARDNPHPKPSYTSSSSKSFPPRASDEPDAPHARNLDGDAMIPNSLRTPEFIEAWEQRWFPYQIERHHGFHVLSQERQLARLKELGPVEGVRVIDLSIEKGSKQLCVDRRNGTPNRNGRVIKEDR